MGKEVVEEGREGGEKGEEEEGKEFGEHLYVCSFGTGPNQSRLLS